LIWKHKRNGGNTVSDWGFSFMEKEQKCFIRYLLQNGDALVKTELEMLKNNNISGILPVLEIHDNGSVSLLYDITAKQQFAQRMSAVFNGEQLYTMLQSVCTMLLLLDEYMIDLNHLVLDIEYICFDYKENKVQFVVLPLKNGKGTADVHEFFVNIFSNLIYADNVLLDFPAYIYDYLNNSPKINAKEFHSYLENMYQSLCGIIQPVEQVPEAPAIHHYTEKEIIDTEEVKRTVQSRFITQSEKIIELDAVKENDVKSQQIQKTIQEDGGLQKVRPGGFSVPIPSGAFTTPPAKERKQKVKPVKKSREKPKKEVKEKPVKEKNKDKPKEKKGLFGFGKKSKKEKNNEASIASQPSVIQPVNNINNVRVPLPAPPPTPPYNNMSQPSVPSYNNMSQSSVPPYNNMSQPSAPLYGGVQPLAWSTAKKEKEDAVRERDASISLDPDATMILSGGDGEFDSTVLLEPINSIPEPALRSRVTGEVIKIGYSGFIIGRNKMVNGRMVEMPEGKRPDASINIKSISHTHAVFLWHDDQWYIQDKNSLNGTFVNGERVNGSEERAINEGDIICFASEEYEYIFVR